MTVKITASDGQNKFDRSDLPEEEYQPEETPDSDRPHGTTAERPKTTSGKKES